MRFGRVKFYAHRMTSAFRAATAYPDINRHFRSFGESIPLFRDNRANREIDAHADRIRRAKTKRRRRGPSAGEW